MVVLSACTSDNDDNPVAGIDDRIVGKWCSDVSGKTFAKWNYGETWQSTEFKADGTGCTHIYYTANGKAVASEAIDFTYTASADGKLTMTPKDRGVMTAKWKLTGDELRIDNGDGISRTFKKLATDMAAKFDKWSKDDEFIALLREAESTSSLIENLKSYFIKAVDMYKGVDASGKEIVTIDEVEMPKLGEKTLSLEELQKIAQAKNFEELVSTLHLEGHLEIFEANTDKFFTKKNTGPIPEFLSSLKKWKKGSPLYDGSFKDGKCPQEDWPKDMYASFCYLKELKGFLSDIDKKVEKVKLHKFLIAHTPQLFDAWQAYKAENKLQSFNDMILSVHKAVMEPGSALKERLSAQYTYAIIDEFQDTNQLQWDIFSNVFQNFVVGDPKQSIYSFQGADVNVYKKATGEIGKKIDLVHNFRSTDGIINGCNALFSGNYFAPAEGMPELVKFTDSYPPDGENADQKKKAPEIDGNGVRSIWLSEKDISADSFAA
jgi:exodeoxyribonuclease V beta subunit